MEELLQSLAEDVKNIFAYDIETTQAYVVPTRHDNTLTFQIETDKKGKLLETCVLFIDIRNSTKISRALKKDKKHLGKIYSAFIYAMTKIADEYGYVRNIVGDRVMVVFEPKDCFVNAVNCAALMYSVASTIIKRYAKVEDFRVGIGIEYGEMLVLKTGIVRKHEEQSEYKSLVWVGDTANIASKLTDFSNKEYNSPLYKVTCEDSSFVKVLKEKPQTPRPLLYSRSFPTYLSSIPPSLLDLIPPTPTPEPEYEYKLQKQNRTYSLGVDEFNRKIEWGEEIKYDGKKVINIAKEVRSGTTCPVLLSGTVYKEYKKAVPASPLLSKLAHREYPDSPFTGSGIYGGYLLLPEAAKLKFS